MSNGRFEKDNKIGKETRFKRGNKISSKYKDRYCDDLLAFFAEPPRDVIYEREYYKDGTLKREKPIVLAPKFPTFELFATKIGVVPNTLLNWCASHPRFEAAYALARELQLGIAIRGATEKHYDGNFTKFILMNRYGFKDKQEIDNNVNAEVSGSIKALDDKDRELIRNAMERLAGNVKADK